MSKVIVDKNKDKVNAPKMKVIKKIGDDYYGIVYYTVTANIVQRYLSFRLKPAMLEFEWYSKGTYKIRFGIMVKFLSLGLSIGVDT